MTVMPALECGLALEEKEDGDEGHDHGDNHIDSLVEDNEVTMIIVVIMVTVVLKK